LAAGVSPRALRSLPSQEVPRRMLADSSVVLSKGIVAETPQGLTVILGRARAGDEQARGELIALIYDELRRVASRLMRRERPDHTLPPTAVFHEPVIRGQGLDLVAVHEALHRPAELDGRQAQVMTLRYFGGMTVAEVAAALGVSVATVEHDWRLARAWLAGQLGGWNE
jgi:RNA polymerase sigma-70 factor, ECF subfamily